MRETRSGIPAESRRGSSSALAGPATLLLTLAVAAPPALVALLWSPAAIAADDASDKAAGNTDASGDSSASEKAEKSGEEQGEKRAKEGETRVYTNDVLKKYRARARESRPATRTVVVDTTPKPPEPDQAGAITAEEKQRRMAELQAGIQEAMQRLSAIAAREASLHNPFLPRPRLSEEEQMQSAGKGAKEQLAMLDQEKETLEAKLTEQREALEEIRRMPVKKAAHGEPGEEGAGPTGAAPASPEP